MPTIFQHIHNLLILGFAQTIRLLDVQLMFQQAIKALVEIVGVSEGLKGLTSSMKVTMQPQFDYRVEQRTEQTK